MKNSNEHQVPEYKDELKVLNDEETWTEIANILAGIQNGADAEYSETQGIEKAFIKQETDAILTIVALKIFPKYLEKMKTDLLSSHHAHLKERVMKMKENLVTKNDNVPMNCNPRCHDSGKEDALDRVLALLE